jgi:hypothetical protein
MKSRQRTSTLNHTLQGVLLGVKKNRWQWKALEKKNLENMQSRKIGAKNNNNGERPLLDRKTKQKVRRKNEFLEQTEQQKMGSS